MSYRPGRRPRLHHQARPGRLCQRGHRRSRGSSEPGTTTTTTTTATEPTGSATEPTGGTTEPVIEPTPCEGEATPIDAAAIAFLVAPDVPPCDGNTGTGCWEGPPADSLWVRLSSMPHVCGEAHEHPPCGNWALGFPIAPEFQVPGIYHLSGPEIVGQAIEVDAEPVDGQCETRWETFNATLEIISVDDTGITGRLCHVDSPLYADDGLDLEGSFFAPRCIESMP
ncbi:hypothetical protein [Nannocystis radixulma]|uniref:Uncharacterized protein n=1 Tax=Nannocystis radixulma TaxID=2995305 RepID=A0ABT5BC38_9BACT|nr:hypothetical protein [Nannocystis radixulma]MDC0671018.1 hypothetical protein [Nannocystis radixulma]